MLARLLAAQLRPYVRQVALIIVLLTGQAVGNLYLPNLNADIINEGVVKGDVGYIWRTGAVMLAISLVLAVLAVVSAYLSSFVAMSVGRDLRLAIFSRVQSFSAIEMNRFGAPSLITRNTNDVQQLQMFVIFGLMIMVLAPITAVGGVVMALHEDVTLSGLLLVIVPVMGLVIGTILYFAVPLFRVMQVKIDRINQVLREQISGIRVVRAFVRTDYERERFDAANRDLTLTALRVNRLFTIAMPAMFTIFNLSSVAVLWFGGHLVDSGKMPIGNLTAFLTYLLQILMAVMMATMITIFVPRASACADRVGEVLATEPSLRDPERPMTPGRATGRVEFRDVTFQYPGAEHPVLRDVSFAVAPGRTTAIVGSTGSGKSTVVNLIARFFDVTGGSVRLDGVDVREQAHEQVWRRIGLVPQRAYLFTGTVASNLRLGRPEATDEELWAALGIAQAADFVSAMPEQLQAPISQGGTNVSGGQRQRLAIARALVKRPEIFLFDDCFSALDAATDARLRAALKAHTRETAVLIVSQRVTTVLHADQIIVLDDGEVVGEGTHSELMRSCPTYQEIVDSQLHGEAVGA
jgi:ATP-binding cassette, subfamily B, multidrug efflux pump